MDAYIVYKTVGKGKKYVLVSCQGRIWTAVATTDPGSASKKMCYNSFCRDIGSQSPNLKHKVDEAFIEAKTIEPIKLTKKNMVNIRKKGVKITITINST